MAEFGRDDPLWPGQLATFVALLLYLVLPAALTIGPRWPLPLTEAAVLAALVMATRGGREATRRREIAIALVLLAAVANVSALGFLVHYLLTERQARDADLLNGGESSTGRGLPRSPRAIARRCCDRCGQARWLVRSVAARTSVPSSRRSIDY